MPRHSVAEASRTRAAIIASAAARASVDGFEGLTIGALAGDLGLSKAGVIGPFGSKLDLQLAALDQAARQFTRWVWDPAADLPAGLVRLRAVAQNWFTYLLDCPLPGGCLITTAAVEWDAREGPLREAVARTLGRWLRVLEAEAEIAVRAGELPRGTDPAQVAFELNALAMSLNQSVQLFRDPGAADRAQRALERLLGISAPPR